MLLSHPLSFFAKLGENYQSAEVILSQDNEERKRDITATVNRHRAPNTSHE